MGSLIVPPLVTTGTRLSAPPEPNTIVTGPLSLSAPAAAGVVAFRRSLIPWSWSICAEETAALYSVLVPHGRSVRRARSGVFSHARLDFSVSEPNGIPGVLAGDQRSLHAQLRPGGFHGTEPDRPGCAGCALLSQAPAPGRRGRAVSGLPREGRGAHGSDRQPEAAAPDPAQHRPGLHGADDRRHAGAL